MTNETRVWYALNACLGFRPHTALFFSQNSFIILVDDWSLRFCESNCAMSEICNFIYCMTEKDSFNLIAVNKTSTECKTQCIKTLVIKVSILNQNLEEFWFISWILNLMFFKQSCITLSKGFCDHQEHYWCILQLRESIITLLKTCFYC